jgi:hypothetical protein
LRQARPRKKAGELLQQEARKRSAHSESSIQAEIDNTPPVRLSTVRRESRHLKLSGKRVFLMSGGRTAQLRGRSPPD